LQNEKFTLQEVYTPAKFEIVAAQFTVDDQWYRAQILGDNITKGSKEEPSHYEVRYVDYGNRELLSKDRIRVLPADYLDFIKPQAHDGHLLWVKAPSLDNEFGRDSAEGFRELVWGKTLYAQEVYKERIPSKDQKEPQYLYHLTLLDEDKTDINIEMISRGYARVERKKERDDPMYKDFLKAQDFARSERINIWQYGDYPDSEEEREVERSLLR